ncbi:MAG: CRISPR-associated endonuclease Cas1 [Reyranella sp.]|uniref:CRISPR-associated endonuclease Cas1 n=1 Tax=Reyranella sp. TaxID=1929291 RepID=UPI0011F74FAD|nr:CRISPR-associated endonuclease Cas1 [Reyranella sp.]TAJ42787.1 MAG: CRISPR-associated endonuclease Cas1 [Reyranella sp.]
MYAIARTLRDWLGRPVPGIQANHQPTQPPQPEDAPMPAGLPLHVTGRHSFVRLQDGAIIVEREGREVERLRLHEISQVALHGTASATGPAIRELLTHGIPVLWRGESGWLAGLTADLSGRVSRTRRAHYAAAADPVRCLEIGRGIVAAKLANTRALLRRRPESQARRTFMRLGTIVPAIAAAPSLAVLRGLEGSIAALHFAAWPVLLKAPDPSLVFGGRSRRPPRDPPNALLSYLYAVLAGECTAAVLAAGLDPAVGFLHVERPGRPALALDLLEPFRLAVADSAALFALNSGEITGEHFESADGGIRLGPLGRRRALAVLERRLGEPVRHPETASAVDWRRAIHLDAARLARGLRNGTPVAFLEQR